MEKQDFPLISVVVLNYNGLKYLKKTIPNLLNLDYPNYEIILIDNASIDSSVEYIQGFKKIKLFINKKNLGYSFGKNIGAEKAKGKYILMLDDDILITDEKFLKKISLYKNKKQIISPIIVDKNDTATNYLGGYFNLFGRRNTKKVSLNKIKKNNKEFPASYYNGGAFFIKKTDWRYLGGFDVNQPFNLDDTDLGTRAWIMGLTVVISPKLLVTHLGAEKRESNKDWCWKYRYYFSGYGRMIIKNYNKTNLFKGLIFFYIHCLLKTMKQTICRRSVRVIYAFIYSNFLFFKNFSNSFKKRAFVQSKRTIKDDIFLKIKPPEFA